MNNSDKTITIEEIQSMIETIPALVDIAQSATLKNYFETTLHKVKVDKDNLDYVIFEEALYEETKRLYGEDKAKDVLEEARKVPVFETGNHLWFPRNSSGLYTEDKDNYKYFYQSAAISAVAMEHLGSRYNICLNSSSVNLSSDQTGNFYALCPEIPLPTTTLKVMNSGAVFYRMDKMEENKYFHGAYIATRMVMLREAIKNEPKLNKFHCFLDTLLQPLASKQLGGKKLDSIISNYKKVSAQKKQILTVLLERYSARIKKIYGMDPAELRTEFATYAKLLRDPKAKTMPDQAALVQTYVYNRIMKKAGLKVENIAIDAAPVLLNYFIKSFKNKDSILYKIFSSQNLRQKFTNDMAGIRSGWGEGMSPFVQIKKDKNGTLSFHKRPYDDADHTPEKLAKDLEKENIFPANLMLMVPSINAGVICHGAMFQSHYAHKFKDAYGKFLKEVGEESKAETVEKLPVEFSVGCISVDNNTETGRPILLEEMSKYGEAFRDVVIYCSGIQAVANAVPVLKKYLDATSPGHLQEPRSTRNPLAEAIYHEIIGERIQQQKRMVV